jgi:acyl-coenzyme A synthetase/AMP-(fatty) acid ligase
LRSYGSTEHPTSIGAQRGDRPERRKYTEGRPLDGCDVRIVDDEGRDVPMGHPGEILSRGADLFFGYVDVQLTKRAIDSDGWYHTEDLAVMDAEGYITIVDRKKDIIKTSGFLVFPAEVEEVLASFPTVAEAAVIGVPDPERGEIVKAMVVARSGAKINLSALEAHCLQHLGKHKRPKQIDVVAELPKNFLGKIQRRRLREAQPPA